MAAPSPPHPPGRWPSRSNLWEAEGTDPPPRTGAGGGKRGSVRLVERPPVPQPGGSCPPTFPSPGLQRLLPLCSLTSSGESSSQTRSTDPEESRVAFLGSPCPPGPPTHPQGGGGLSSLSGPPVRPSPHGPRRALAEPAASPVLGQLSRGWSATPRPRTVPSRQQKGAGGPSQAPVRTRGALIPATPCKPGRPRSSPSWCRWGGRGPEGSSRRLDVPATARAPTPRTAGRRALTAHPQVAGCPSPARCLRPVLASRVVGRPLP